MAEQDNGSGSSARPDAAETALLQALETLAARLCHDLASPLGALAGALDLARGEQGAAAPADLLADALEVAQDAATTITQRIRLLRAAWSAQCPALDGAGLRELAAGLPNAARLVVELPALPHPAPPPVARLLLNLLLLAAAALPGGGRIVLAGTLDDAMTVQISGARAAWPRGLAACLMDATQIAPMLGNPRDLQVPLTALLAHATGQKLRLLMGPGDAPAPLLLDLRAE